MEHRSHCKPDRGFNQGDSGALSNPICRGDEGIVKEQADFMTWAEDRLKELNVLIDENYNLIKKYPNTPSLKLALHSKLQHKIELLKKINNGE